MKTRSVSQAEMEERVARFAGMKPNKVAFVDTRLPDHERDIFNMIGYGVNEDPDTQARHRRCPRLHRHP